MATLVIGIGPKPGDKGAPPPSGDDQGGYSDDDAAQEGQEIVQKVQALDPDDLAKLFAGISPDALEVMEKVDCLAPLADFIENGGNSSSPDADDKSAPPPSDLRGQIGAAMQKSMSGPQGA